MVDLPGGRKLEAVSEIHEHRDGESTATFRLDGDLVTARFRLKSAGRGLQAFWRWAKLPVLAVVSAVLGHHFPKLIAFLTGAP